MDVTSSPSIRARDAATARRAWSLPRAVVSATALTPLVAFVAFTGTAFLAFGPVPYFVGVLALLGIANLVVANRWLALAAGVVGLLFAGADLGPGGDPYAFRPDLGWLHLLSVLVVAAGVVGLCAGIAAVVRARRGGFGGGAVRWGVLALGVALGFVAASAWGEGLVVAHPASTGSVAVGLTPDVTLTLTESHDAFQPASLSVPAGKLVKLTLTNSDPSLHNFHVDGLPVSTDTPAGQQTVVWLKVDKPGDYAFACSIHPGMTGTLHVA